MRFQHLAQQIVLQDYIHAVQDAETRRDRLTAQIQELLPNWSLAPIVGSLQAMRGVALVAAVTVVAEVGDFRRFTNPRQLMAYLGLVPSEHSSGGSVRRGGITKAGNALARRVLIEGAWTYRMSARVSRKIQDRLEPLSAEIRDTPDWCGFPPFLKATPSNRLGLGNTGDRPDVKPTISRAMAVVTTTLALPAETRRRYLAHSRTCAFQAMTGWELARKIHEGLTGMGQAADMM